MNKPKFRAWDRNDKKMRKVESISLLTNFIECELEPSDDPSKYYGTMCVPLAAGEYILMQYTGLKDKNGVEIFGKDVVEGFYGGTYVKGVIQFIDGCYCLQRIGDFHAICLFEVDNRNILGSIHANPELLNEVE